VVAATQCGIKLTQLAYANGVDKYFQQRYTGKKKKMAQLCKRGTSAATSDWVGEGKISKQTKLVTEPGVHRGECFEAHNSEERGQKEGI